MKKISVFMLLLTMNLVVYAQSEENKDDVLRTLQEFETAIVENNSVKAEAILYSEARIVEGSKIETKEEYLSHHFHSDGRFLSVMNREIISQEVFLHGETGWVATKSHLSGMYNDRELSLNSMELAVLKKTDGIWKIVAVHWSSN